MKNLGFVPILSAMLDLIATGLFLLLGPGLVIAIPVWAVVHGRREDRLLYGWLTALAAAAWMWLLVQFI